MTETVTKLKVELVEATSSLNFVLTADNHLGLENEAATGEISVLKKSVEDLKAEIDLLQEKCHAAEDKERAATQRVDNLSLDIANLGQKMTQLTQALDLYELKGFLIKQHDLGFDSTVRQAKYF